MTDSALKPQAFKLKGRLYTLTVIYVLDVDANLFSNQLVDVIAQAPLLFDKAPIVLDLSALDGARVDLARLCECVREHGLFPVAIQGGDVALNHRAQTYGLAVLHASSTQDKPIAEITPEPALMHADEYKTKFISTPVRSGQQIVSKTSDLIVNSSVSHGAELLSEGNIHVYGALRGKALAGISGDKQARIFCQVLDAELVAIAGIYQVRDSMQFPEGPCQIYIQDDHIKIDPL